MAIAEVDSATGGGGIAPGSYPLSEVAVIKMRGGDIPEPGSRDEEIILAAWQMYRWISARATREGTGKRHDNGDWHTWQGKPEDAAHMLWPAGRASVTGEDWLSGFQIVKNWLLRTGNLVSTDSGRPGTNNKRGGMIAPRSPHWLVRDQFTGAPEGMKLPDLDDSGKPVPVPSSVPVKPVAEASAAAMLAPDWWCPLVLTGHCQLEGPYTREGLGTHIQNYHKYRRGDMMYDVLIGDAEELRGERKDSGYQSSEPAEVPEIPEPPAPAPDHPARSIVEMTTPPPAPVAPRHRDRSQRHAADPAPAVPVGSISAQARVYADSVAALEAEVVALRRRNAELEAEIHQVRAAQREVRLCQQDIDAIAHRTAAAVVASIDGATA